MKNVLLFLLFFLAIDANGEANMKVIDSLKIEINNLKKNIDEISDIKKRIDDIYLRQEYQESQINTQVGMLDTAFDGISAEVSASSNFISIFGIIIAIVSIGLGIYVTRIENSVRAMRDDNEQLLQKNIQIKKDLESLSEKITRDSTGLYKLVRNEESNHMIERLISIPEDIVNLIKNLISRDLEQEHFFKLKEAYMQVKNDYRDGINMKYITLFFQHFSGLSVRDQEIKPDFIKNLSTCFELAFKNDVVKSVRDFFYAVKEMGLDKSENEINEYIKYLCASNYSKYEGVYFEINLAIGNREDKFMLYDRIKKNQDTLIFRQEFGKLLLDYNYDNLTAKESDVVKDIKTISQ